MYSFILKKNPRKIISRNNFQLSLYIKRRNVTPVASKKESICSETSRSFASLREIKKSNSSRPCNS